MPELTISHRPGEGTVITGDPRPHHGIIKAAGYRWSRNVGWYVPRSRDALPNRPAIERLADELRAAGFDVVTDISDERRSFDEIDADRAERAEQRATGLAAKADRLSGQSDAAYEAARRIGDMIPLGQPILVDHYSAKGHRRALDKMNRNMGRSVELHKEATETERRAAAAEATQAHRESVPAMIRRAERLEAESRKLVRDYLTPCKTSGVKLKADAPRRDEMQCPACYRTVAVVEVFAHQEIASHGSVVGRDSEPRYRAAVARVDEEAAHLRRKIAEAAEAGVKVWGPDDFTKGDEVNYWGGWMTVVRVNKKSVTVQTRYSWTETVPYDKVRGQRTPQPADA